MSTKEVSHRACGLSIPGHIQNPTAHCPEQPAPAQQGGWARPCPEMPAVSGFLWFGNASKHSHSGIYHAFSLLQQNHQGILLASIRGSQVNLTLSAYWSQMKTLCPDLLFKHAASDPCMFFSGWGQEGSTELLQKCVVHFCILLKAAKMFGWLVILFFIQSHYW